VGDGTVLVRKLELAVWTDLPSDFAGSEVPAVVVQHNDFRAKGNALSFWRFDTTTTTWRDDAVLAVVGGWKRVDGVHLVYLDQDAFPSGVRLEPSPGDTCFEQLRSSHAEALTLDARRLAHIAECIAEYARAGENVITKTREEVIDLLVSATKDRDMIKVDHLPKPLKDVVNDRLSRTA
jgi:hypothetical protein